MNYISLGHACAIARNLEKLGLRNSSMPFDWSITNFEGVIKAINNNFANFLDYDLLFQNSQVLKHYKNTEYNIQFFHDFNKFETLEKQLPIVRAKYDRRIKRFYEEIQKPTTFIRYISPGNPIDGKSEELIWIEENYDYIISTLKSFNPENDIIFIANKGIESSKIKIFNVEIVDKTDTINRMPLNNNLELNAFFMNKVDDKTRKSMIFKRNKARISNFFSNIVRIDSIIRIIKLTLYRCMSREYIHHKQY